MRESDLNPSLFTDTVVFDNIEEYAPGFKQLIVGHEVLTPRDLETVFGLTGGVSGY